MREDDQKKARAIPNEKLKLERLRRKLTHAQLAELIDIADPRTISRWERGITIPSPLSRQKLCDVFGKSEEELGLRPTQPPPTEESISGPPPIKDAGNKNRQWLIARVQAFWITGLLEQSLHGAALIALGLKEQADAVANPWRLVLQLPNQLVRPLPPGTRIIQVFNDAASELLILGEPGSGKTTLLLELARDLLIKAKLYDAHPIPVIFNLSSWAVKRSSIADWLVEELNDKYQVPRKLGQTWIDDDQILPLLDGLDEVTLASRGACVEAVNAYRQVHGLLPIVICSRTNEYFAQQTRVRINRAVTVQPLTQEQVEAYLVSGGEAFSALRTALQQDAALNEMTNTPLMLNILTLAYQGMSAEDLNRAGFPTTRQQVFEHYTRRMLLHRGVDTGYTPQQTVRWLSWLARQLRQHKQTEFYLEHLQKDWLPKEKGYRLCLGLVFGGAMGLLVMLIYIATFLLDPSKVGWYDKVVTPLFLGVFTAALFLLLYGVLFPWLDTPETQIHAATLTNGLARTSKQRLSSLFKTPIFYGLSVGLLHAWFLGRYNVRLSHAVILGLLFGIGYALVGRVDADIRPAEVVSWSWRSIQKHPVRFLGTGLLIGLLYGLTWGPLSIIFNSFLTHQGISFSDLFNQHMIAYTLPIGTAAGLGVGIIFVLIGGISYDTLERSKHVRPNQGIHRSARNSLFFGLTFGIFAGLLIALLYRLIFSFLFNTSDSPYFPYALTGLGWGIGVGIAVAAVVSLRNGAVVCMQHVLLRFLLWRGGVIPWDYPRFLDYAAEMVILRKIGGGYIFIHHLLLEYFASL